MKKQDLTKVVIIALITTIGFVLPGLLYQRGLRLGWAIALLAGYITVAILGYLFGK